VVTPVIPFYAPREGQQGKLQENWYRSELTDRWRRCIVYTPPGYDEAASSGTRFPVLYLQHGAGEDENAWSRQGGVNFIIDNSIKGGAAGRFAALFGGAIRKAKPMIVVMDNGYATYKVGTASDSRDASENYLSAFLRNGVEAFGAVLVKELIPMIDRTYRTIADRDHRAMAGSSMGGMQTMAIALAHLDTFSEIGSFSGAQFARPRASTEETQLNTSPFDPATAYGGVFADAAAFNSKVRLLWVGAGTAESSLSESQRENVEKLRAANIKVTQYYSPGTAHEWQTWRNCINQFAQLLFQV
jgi:enterochelin esterase-like enzyme